MWWCLVHDMLKEMGVIHTLIVGDAHRVCPLLRGNSFGVVHVDAEHTFRGALQDMRAALCLIAPGGTIVCDDVDASEVERATEVSGLSTMPSTVISVVKSTGQKSVAYQYE